MQTLFTSPGARPFFFSALLLGAASLSVACGGDEPSDNDATGGSTNTGGTASSGGSSATGGASADCEVSEQNACGGCELLTGAPGDSCGECGSLACDGTNALSCSCAEEASCEATADSCACSEGYEPGSSSCVDVDECATAGTCPAEASCENTEGSFSCVCPAGSVFESGSCVPEITGIKFYDQVDADGPTGSSCLEVKCPVGQVALAGGFSHVADISPDDSSRLSSKDGWRVCGLKGNQSVPAQWSVQATCATVHDSVQIETTPNYDFTIADGEARCVISECPSETPHVLSANLHWASHGRITQFRPLTSDDDDEVRWHTCVESDAGEVSVRLSLNCSSQAVAPRYVFTEHNTSTSAQRCQLASCNLNETLVSGGGQVHDGQLIATSRGLNNDWESCAATTMNTGLLGSAAVCLAN